MTRGKTKAVKDFAAEMKTAHTATTEKLKPLAKTAGVTPPTQLDDAHQAMLKDLTDAKDADFDALYIDQQVSAHKTALALFEAYAATGSDDSALIAFAKETAPTIEQHLEHAKMLDEQTDTKSN